MRAIFYPDYYYKDNATIHYSYIYNCPHSIMVEGDHYKFTGRIKYIKERLDELTYETTMYLEVTWKKIELIKDKWYNILKKPTTQTYTDWIPEYAFEFDYSDEAIENIYECET